MAHMISTLKTADGREFPAFAYDESIVGMPWHRLGAPFQGTFDPELLYQQWALHQLEPVHVPLAGPNGEPAPAQGLYRPWDRKIIDVVSFQHEILQFGTLVSTFKEKFGGATTFGILDQHDLKAARMFVSVEEGSWSTRRQEFKRFVVSETGHVKRKIKTFSTVICPVCNNTALAGERDAQEQGTYVSYSHRKGVGIRLDRLTDAIMLQGKLDKDLASKFQDLENVDVTPAQVDRYVETVFPWKDRPQGIPETRAPDSIKSKRISVVAAFETDNLGGRTVASDRRSALGLYQATTAWVDRVQAKGSWASTAFDTAPGETRRAALAAALELVKV